MRLAPVRVVAPVGSDCREDGSARWATYTAGTMPHSHGWCANRLNKLFNDSMLAVPGTVSTTLASPVHAYFRKLKENNSGRTILGGRLKARGTPTPRRRMDGDRTLKRGAVPMRNPVCTPCRIPPIRLVLGAVGDPACRYPSTRLKLRRNRYSTKLPGQVGARVGRR